ncbi:piggyBac transposable element-derived protein 4-like [Periplaneta americana]|uniref:piggyBac transposable element-derived protein 4-like n=1 Tax=Periplaneta americana TaxID=6978 RepID=UPI0037E8BB04
MCRRIERQMDASYFQYKCRKMETIKTDPDQPQDINHLKFFSDSGTIKVKEERISDSEVESDYDDFKRDISEAHLDDVESTAIFDVSVKSERIDFKEELDPEIQSDSLPISNGIQLEAQFSTFLDSNTEQPEVDDFKVELISEVKPDPLSISSEASFKADCITTSGNASEVEKNDSNPDLGTEFHFDEASGDEFCFSWNGDSEPELTTSDSENDAEDQKEVPVTKIKKRKLEPWSWRSNCVLRSDDLSEETFCGSAGLSCEVSALGSSVEIADITFRFLDEDFWEMLRDGCNRYASFKMKNNQNVGSEPSEWFDCTTDELKAFIALCIIQSHIKKHDLEAYWSTGGVTETPFFATVMPFRRFSLIYKYLYIADKSNLNSSDSFLKVGHYLDYMNEKFTKLYTPEQDIVIVEKAVKCQDKKGFVRAKCGVVYNKLCEAETGYCCQLQISVDNRELDKVLSSREEVVMKMMASFLNKGHTLYLSSWFSSPTLFKRLIEAKTNVLGTVQEKSKQIPEDLIRLRLNKGTAIARYGRRMMFVKWMDKKPVYILTTKHKGIEMTDIGKENKSELKPKCVIDYDKGNDGVKRMNRKLESFPLLCSCAKSHKNILFVLLEIVLYNSFVLFNKLRNTKLLYRNFRLLVAEHMLKRVHLPNYEERGQPFNVVPARLRASHLAHFARHIPAIPTNSQPTRQCVVCCEKNVEARTRWECENCGAALHMPDCFEMYHTQRILGYKKKNKKKRHRSQKV